MSDFSKFLHKLGDVFSHGAAQVPADQQPALTDAATKVSAAAGAVESAMPVMAKAAADVAVAQLGPIGLAFTPALNMFIDALVYELTARKQPLPASVAALIAPPTPPQPG